MLTNARYKSRTVAIDVEFPIPPVAAKIIGDFFENSRAVPEIIDPVFAKTSPKRSFSMTESEHFGLVFTKARVYKFGHWGDCVLSVRYPIADRLRS
jgi:hypothetical protein